MCGTAQLHGCARATVLSLAWFHKIDREFVEQARDLLACLLRAETRILMLMCGSVLNRAIENIADVPHASLKFLAALELVAYQYSISIEALEHELYRQGWLVPYWKVSTASNHCNLEPGKAFCEGMAWKRKLVLATPPDLNRADIAGAGPICGGMDVRSSNISSKFETSAQLRISWS